MEYKEQYTDGECFENDILKPKNQFYLSEIQRIKVFLYLKILFFVFKRHC